MYICTYMHINYIYVDHAAKVGIKSRRGIRELCFICVCIHVCTYVCNYPTAIVYLSKNHAMYVSGE